MFEEALQVLELLQRLDQFLKVFEPPGRFGCFVVLPHRGVAGFVQHDTSQFGVIDIGVACHAPPARQITHQLPQCRAALALDQPLLHRQCSALDQRHPVGAGDGLNGLLGLVPQSALGCVDDALKCQIIVRADDEAEIGHGIADLHPFVKAWATNDTVGQTDGQKPVFECAHLVRGADKDRHLIKAHPAHSARATLHRLNLFADPAGLFLAIPMTDEADLFTVLGIRPKRLAKSPFVARDDRGGGSEDMRCGAIVLFQPNNMCAVEILLEPQDVAHLGPAPAIDGLVIIANAADILVP